MNTSLSITIACVGGLVSLVGALIVLNLRSIKNCLRKFDIRIDKQDIKLEKFDTEIKEIKLDFSKCKIDCDRNTVSKEDWVRSEGFTRRELKDVSSTLSRIEGKFTIVEKVPEIVGNVVREVTKELNRGANNHV